MVLYARHGTRAGFRVLEENILFTERSAGRGDDSRPGVCAPAKSTRVTRHIRRRVAPPSARVSTGVGSARPSIAIQLYSAIQRCTLYSCIALYDTIHTSTTPLSASVLDIQSARNCPDPPRGTRTAPDRAAANCGVGGPKGQIGASPRSRAAGGGRAVKSVLIQTETRALALLYINFIELLLFLLKQISRSAFCPFRNHFVLIILTPYGVYRPGTTVRHGRYR